MEFQTTNFRGENSEHFRPTQKKDDRSESERKKEKVRESRESWKDFAP